ALEQVTTAIRQAVAEEHQLQVYAVVLIKPTSLPRTSSGKVQHYAARAAFLEGHLQVVARHILDERAAVGPDATVELNRAALRGVAPQERRQLLLAFLRAQAARVLRIGAGQLDLQQPLVQLGLD